MLHHLMPLISSPWLYVVVFVAVAIDGFFPVMPSETLVIGLFALSATGRPSGYALAAVVAAGGIAGDQITYRFGRRLGSRMTDGRMAQAREKAERALQRYGGVAILVGRFVPYGRTATTVTAGSVSLPPGRFRLFTALASVAWAFYSMGLGRLGGATFAHSPLLGAALGMVLGLAVAGVCAVVEKRRAVAARKSSAVADTTAAAAGETLVEEKHLPASDTRCATARRLSAMGLTPADAAGARGRRVARLAS